MKRHTAVIATTVPVTLSTFMREYIDQLAAAGYKPVLVSSPDPVLEELGTEYRAAEVVKLRMSRDLTPLKDLRALAIWLWCLFRVRPRIVVAMTPKAALLAMVASCLTAVPSRIYLSGGLRLEGESGLRRRVLAMAERITCACATDVVLNSKSLMEAYERHQLCPPSKMRRTEPGSSHGVDVAHYDPTAMSGADHAALGLNAQLITVTFIGRLTRDKGLETLIRASERLSAEGLEHQLLIVGPHDEPDSGHFVTELDSMTSPILVTGPVSDVRPYLALTDIHVLPSLREGFPNVVLEAAAMGLPSVVTDATGCIDSVIDGITGLVFPVGDAQALAEAIHRLASSDDLRISMGRYAREWVAAEFCPKDVVASVLGPAMEAL